MYYIHDNIYLKDPCNSEGVPLKLGDLLAQGSHISGFARVTYFDSLTEFVNTTYRALSFKDESDKSFKRKIKYEVKPLIRDGWKEVLSQLHKVEALTRGAFAPVTKTKWDWQGTRVDVDRTFVGKPCFARPVRKPVYKSMFIRILFIGESMTGSGIHFASKIATLLSYIRQCESQGQHVELYVGFGAQNRIFTERHNYGLLNIARIKGFNEQPNMLEIASLGHPSMFRGLQFGWEVAQKQFVTHDQMKTKGWKEGPTCVGWSSYINPDYYRRALATIISQEEADSTYFICKQSDIDPDKLEEKYNK